MNEFFEGLTTYCASLYNTQVNSVVLIPGENFTAADMPASPDFCLALIHSPAARDPASPLRKPEFQLVVRAPRANQGLAIRIADEVGEILGKANNVVPHHPGIVRALEEPGYTGLDDNKRFIVIRKFVIWSVKL